MTKILTDKPIKCHYCHQKTYMEIVGESSRDVRSQYFGPVEPGVSYPAALEKWDILACPNCDQVNVIVSQSIGGQLVEGGEVIYPPAHTYTAPKEIDLQFRASIAVIHTNPKAAVNQFRVVLEMIWKDHVPAETVKPELRGDSGIIKQLVDMNVLSGNYADMADALAWLSNVGSHADDRKVTRADAEVARQLCHAILEHVYRIRPQGLDLMEKIEGRFPRNSGWRGGKYVNKNDW